MRRAEKKGGYGALVVETAGPEIDTGCDAVVENRTENQIRCAFGRVVSCGLIDQERRRAKRSYLCSLTNESPMLAFAIGVREPQTALLARAQE